MMCSLIHKEPLNLHDCMVRFSTIVSLALLVGYLNTDCMRKNSHPISYDMKFRMYFKHDVLLKRGMSIQG